MYIIGDVLWEDVVYAAHNYGSVWLIILEMIFLGRFGIFGGEPNEYRNLIL